MTGSGRRKKSFLKSPGAIAAGVAITGAGHQPGVAGAKRGCESGPGVIAVRPDREPYRVDEKTYRRFSAAQTSFNRLYQRGVDLAEEFLKGMGRRDRQGDPGFSALDQALLTASMAVGESLSFAGSVYDYRLESSGYSFADAEPLPMRGASPAEAGDPATLTRAVKKAARLLGADLVGVCRLDRRWLYSEVWLRDTGERIPLELDEAYASAVVLGFSMDYAMVTASPTAVSAAAVALGYSRQTAASVSLARFIRALGFRAIASGNDTALSVPLAVDAGLGEASRMGMLVTPEYGARVRLAKVITDMPLEPDSPIAFGVREWCRKCMKCARKCPASAIPQDPDPSWSGPSEANNPGVYKWYVDGDRCLAFWLKNGIDCITCIAACPYSKPHELWRTERGPAPGRDDESVYVWLHGRAATDEPLHPADWWTR